MANNETTKADGSESKIPNYQNRALGFLTPDNPIRARAIKIAHSSQFETLSILIILANCLLMAIGTFKPQPHNAEFEYAEDIFNVLFTIELVIKVVAKGFWSGPYAYLKDGWNWLDLIIVLLGWVAYLPGVENFSALRTFRVLRPLKTLSAMPGMRVITNALLNAIPSLINVGVLCMFTFVILGIVGVQLYNGVLDGRCYIKQPPAFENSSDPWIRPPAHNWHHFMPEHADPFDDTNCMMYEKVDWPENVRGGLMITESSGGRKCSPIEIDGGTTVERYCGRHYNQEHTGKGKMEVSFGIGNFDNVLRACLSIYTSITLEGWVDIMYMLYDGFGLKGVTAVYFIVMILFGSFFMLNLTLAVVEGAMGDAEDEMEAEEAQKAEAEAEEHKNDAEEVPAKVKKGGIPFFRRIVQDNDPNKMTMFENFIVVAILANTLVMSMEHYNPDTRDPLYDDKFTTALDLCNDVFTWVFVVELILKVLGLGVREYVADRMNRFDFIITVIPVVEFILKHVSSGSSSSGIGALRSFRLFRLFKLARSWKDLNNLLQSLAESIAGCVNAALLLLIIMFIFTLLGIQLFGGKMTTCQPIGWRLEFTDLKQADFSSVQEWTAAALECSEDEPARGHFDYFWWSFVTVFQVLTGENWNEVLYYAIDGTSWEVSAIYFVLLNVVGQYIVFNIFLAILLGNMEDSGGDESDDAAPAEKGAANGKILPEGEEVEVEAGSGKKGSEVAMGGTSLFCLDVKNPLRVLCFRIISSKMFDNTILSLIGLSSVMLAVDQPFLENCEGANWPNEMLFPDLMAPNELECSFKDLLGILDQIITVLFVIECTLKVTALGFVMDKDSYLRNNWNKLDFFIVVVSIASWAGGSNESLTALKSLRALRALRPLRLLSRYPGMQLVVGSILEGLPEIFNVVVVCLLFYLIFAIIGVQNWKGALNQCNNPEKVCHPTVPIDPEHPQLTCCTGGYYDANNKWLDRDCSKCSTTVNFPDGLQCGADIACGTGDAYLFPDASGNIAWDYDKKTMAGGHFHANADTCHLLSDLTALAECEKRQYCSLFDKGGDNTAGDIVSDSSLYWDSAASAQRNIPALCKSEGDRFNKDLFKIPEEWIAQPANFDNVLHGLLTVFECSSGEMWPNIMYAVMDSVGTDQPFSFEYTLEFTPIYFIAIQIMCAFLLLNLFIGVLVEQYNSMKDGDGAGPLITDTQKMWIETQRLALDCAPERKVVPPQNPTQRRMFTLVESRAFELVIMGCIMLNIVVMALRIYDQSDAHMDFLGAANLVFVIIFSIELVLKMIALEPTEYFRRGWNRFDCFIVILSWIGMLFDLGQFATILRVARVARIFRLVQTNKNLSTLFNTLMLSIPAIGNVASVTLLLFFVYAVMGMNLFAKVKLGDNLTPHANFRSFWGSLMLLFRMSTGESYNGVMHDCSIEPPFCSKEVGDCGEPSFAVFYFMTFFVFSAMLMLNILVAIILDNYGDQEEQDQYFEKVGPEDMQVFKQVWAEKDPLARGYIQSTDLEWVITHIHAPLGLAKRGAKPEDGTEAASGMAKQARNKMKALKLVPECNGKVYFHHVLRELVKNVHGDVDVSNLVNNPRIAELDNKAANSKFEKKAKRQAKSSDNKKQNGEPWSVAESTASLRLQTAWRGKLSRKEVSAKKNTKVEAAAAAAAAAKK